MMQDKPGITDNGAGRPLRREIYGRKAKIITGLWRRAEKIRLVSAYRIRRIHVSQGGSPKRLSFSRDKFMNAILNILEGHLSYFTMVVHFYIPMTWIWDKFTNAHLLIFPDTDFTINWIPERSKNHLELFSSNAWNNQKSFLDHRERIW